VSPAKNGPTPRLQLQLRAPTMRILAARNLVSSRGIAVTALSQIAALRPSPRHRGCESSSAPSGLADCPPPHIPTIANKTKATPTAKEPLGSPRQQHFAPDRGRFKPAPPVRAGRSRASIRNRGCTRGPRRGGGSGAKAPSLHLKSPPGWVGPFARLRPVRVGVSGPTALRSRRGPGG
jgi:hypothetical protein